MNKAIQNVMSFHTRVKHSGMKHNIERYSDADLEIALESSIQYVDRKREAAIRAEIARRENNDQS